MNYIQALQEYLQQDEEISAVVGNRIGFLRMPKNVKKPYIVFSEQEWNPELLNQEDYEDWVDIFPILIDIVVDYKDAIVWRNLRKLIREKLWNFSWQLGENREGQIIFQKFLACDYNLETDWVLRGSLYLLKARR